MTKYRVLIPGKQFMCSECGTVFEGANCRNMAIQCYESHQKPNISRTFLPYDKTPGAPGDGFTV